jgi:hypothetical protein
MSEPSADELDCVKVVPEPQPPKSGKLIHLAGLEHRLPCRYIIASTPSANSLDIDIEIKTTDTGIKHCTRSLVDCGATGLFMDTEWARANNITTHMLTQQMPVYNVNGTPNEGSAICEIADDILRYNRHTEHTQFAITQLGKQSMILGFTWLHEHNPKINWQTKEVHMSHCPAHCNTCRLDAKCERREQHIAICDHTDPCLPIQWFSSARRGGRGQG